MSALGRGLAETYQRAAESMRAQPAEREAFSISSRKRLI
jgi:hypothetical protein